MGGASSAGTAWRRVSPERRQTRAPYTRRPSPTNRPPTAKMVSPTVGGSPCRPGQAAKRLRWWLLEQAGSFPGKPLPDEPVRHTVLAIERAKFMRSPLFQLSQALVILLWRHADGRRPGAMLDGFQVPGQGAGGHPIAHGALLADRAKARQLSAQVAKVTRPKRQRRLARRLQDRAPAIHQPRARRVGRAPLEPI